MPRQSAVSVDNKFSGGLITEASGLNFPENACTETYNCEFHLDGAVHRRLGIDVELNYETKTIARSSSAIAEFLWKNPNGEATVNLFVAQIGSKLYFWDTASTAISTAPITANIDLNSFKPSGGNTPDSVPCQFATGNGKMFVTHPYLDAFYVVYNSTAQTFTSTQINVQIRDFEGLDDGLAVDNRPTSTLAGLTVTHAYNLYNQGWNTANLTTWDGSQTTMPSNADVMWSFKNSTDVFDMATLANVIAGNTPAPKGHFVLNVFEQDRSTASGVAGITTVSTNKNRCSTVAFFAGRTFFSGLSYSGFTSNIYFSQIIETDRQYGNCYQINDPSSENSFDLLPSDGGLIRIADCGSILKLVAIQSGLAVFATNGVWFITGSTGIGFTANDYSVVKVSAIPTTNSTSFVDVLGFPAWWNLDGIYTLTAGGDSPVGLQVTSLTDTTIQSFFQEIPASSKRNAKGFYNKLHRQIQWLYRSDEAGTVDESYNYDRVLNFDIRLKAFYPWSFDNTHDVKINGLVVLEGSSGVAVVNQVIDDSSNTVIDDSSNNVVVFELGNAISEPHFKYLVSYNDGSDKFTMAETDDETYEDWVRYGEPINYTSYLITGYKIRGNAITDFQSNYVVFYSDNESKYTVQGIWDYANTSNSSRWSTSQTINAQNHSNFDVVPQRRKIRGRGKALQLKINSFDGKPFHVIGWSMLASANQTP